MVVTLVARDSLLPPHPYLHCTTSMCRLSDRIKLRDAKPKTWHKEFYTAGVYVVFKPGMMYTV